MKWIKDIKEGIRINGQYLINHVTKGVTGNNQAYLTVTFQDKTGVIEGKLWDYKGDDNDIYVSGNIVDIEADVISYRNNLQLKIIWGEIASSPLDPSHFMAAAPRPLKEMEKELDEIINSIDDEQIRLLVSTLINQHYKQFITFPAATRNHHEFASGLIFHTLTMIKLAEAIIKQYNDLNRDLLIGAVLIHDLGKTIELSGPIIPKYTLKGKLIGHITLMTGEILQYGEKLNIDEEKTVLLAHMVASHHGKLEFGSPVVPQTKEALLLSMIDDLDAKMTMADKALGDVEEGEFSTRVYTLDDRSLYKPKK
jgi:3'-5' exoribonuclease